MHGRSVLTKWLWKINVQQEGIPTNSFPPTHTKHEPSDEPSVNPRLPGCTVAFRIPAISLLNPMVP